MGKRQTAHNSQLLLWFQSSPMQTNSVRDWLFIIRCNWLVIDMVSIATVSNCWELLRVSVPTYTSKDVTGTLVNSRGRNSTENWMISSQTSHPTGMKSVQRLNGTGSENIFDDDLRYSPTLCENTDICRVWHILTRCFIHIIPQKKFYIAIQCRHTHCIASIHPYSLTTHTFVIL